MQQKKKMFGYFGKLTSNTKKNSKLVRLQEIKRVKLTFFLYALDFLVKLEYPLYPVSRELACCQMDIFR